MQVDKTASGKASVQGGPAGAFAGPTIPLAAPTPKPLSTGLLGTLPSLYLGKAGSSAKVVSGSPELNVAEWWVGTKGVAMMAIIGMARCSALVLICLLCLSMGRARAQRHPLDAIIDEAKSIRAVAMIESVTGHKVAGLNHGSSPGLLKDPPAPLETIG